MQVRGSGPVMPRAISFALILFCLSACSTSSNLSVMMFADPGKYQYYTCEQIAAAGKTAASREQSLRQLIEKAERSAGGHLVGAIAYRGEHRTVVEELQVIEQAARAKNCITEPAGWGSSTAIQ
jgi:hypothetical protein